MAPSVRRAGPGDAAVVVEFNQRLAEETEGKTLDEAVLRRGVEAALSDPRKGWYLVAEAEGRVIGQVSVTTEWSDWRNGWFWWLQSVYVRQQWRRKGVFRLLYEEVRRLARAEGEVVGLRLYVERENLTARRTYEQLGMRDSGYVLMELSRE